MYRCCPQAMTKVVGTARSMLPYSHKTHFKTRLKPKTEREGVRIVCGKVGFEQVWYGMLCRIIGLDEIGSGIVSIGRSELMWYFYHFPVFLGLFRAWQKCSARQNNELILINFVAGACGHKYNLGGSYMHKINVGPKYIESCFVCCESTVNSK